MRLIDADALHETLKTKQKWVVRCGDKHNEGYTYDQVHFAIDDAPTIDIVFCKECKYYVNGQCWKSDGLDKLYGNVADDDFCSRVEKRTDA